MERPDEPAAASEPLPVAATPVRGAPTELTDPRVITILSTEHWSLLTARSLVYNETFTRGAMFLTLLSASLVALGFVYQGGGGPEFLSVVVAVLALDLFVGLATLGRIMGASAEEFRTLQATARIRHAYLEIAPLVAPYLSTATSDDPDSVLEVYGQELGGEVSVLLNLGHGLTTMPGMISVLDAALLGGLVGSVMVAIGAEARLALVLGIGSGIAALFAFMVYGIRTFSSLNRFSEVRFPRPSVPTNPPR
ncbi:MAG TPA: hypothetical protein VKB30_05695 [Candidatus Limnocylindrales bacterium]|nr:hypothetical protein [Candidatus Limnocylindrales bacterium]